MRAIDLLPFIPTIVVVAIAWVVAIKIGRKP